MWIAHGYGNSIFAYNLNNKTRDSAKDVSFSNPTPILDFWMNETNIWIVRESDKSKLYAYTLNLSATEATARASRDSAKDITLSNGVAEPRSIWSNGKIMWVTFRAV